MNVIQCIWFSFTVKLTIYVGHERLIIILGEDILTLKITSGTSPLNFQKFLLKINWFMDCQLTPLCIPLSAPETFLNTKRLDVLIGFTRFQNEFYKSFITKLNSKQFFTLLIAKI